jgi:uncharacterized protein
MLRLSEIKLALDHDEAELRDTICRRLGIKGEDLLNWSIFRRGYDARSRRAIKLVYTLDVEVRNQSAVLRRRAADHQLSIAPDATYHFIAKAPQRIASRPVVVGCGPCGLFAALTLAQMGFRPIILERGKIVRERTKDTWALWRRGILNPESNVQFGEGGAGTFSDGKLYSNIKDPRFLRRKVLDELAKAGAPNEFFYLSKPHIGTFRLVSVVERLRATIVSLGGEYRFQTKVEDFDIATGPKGDRQVQGVILSSGEYLKADHIALAIGHSARDTFQTLHDRGVRIEAKPFSIGVRIEHPQSLIDRGRFGAFAGHKMLGAADYKLVHHSKSGRAVYSFCMCPGGRVVAATSENGRVVTNGMSQYSRAESNANAGIVVAVTPADYPGHPLEGINFQRRWESLAFEAGGANYAAPAQTVRDFLDGRRSTKLGDVVPSYKPGVHPSDLSLCLPDFVTNAIREALVEFDREMRGFAMAGALLTGVETRTSSPIRIPRDQAFQSPSARGLFPAGEGAGYAGGILSAAVDGIRVAEAIAAEIAGVAIPEKSLHNENEVTYG